MKTATIDEMARRPEEMFAGEGVVVTRDGNPIGIIHPLPDPCQEVPMEVRRELYGQAIAKMRAELAARGITEEDIDRDIETLFHKDRG